MKLGKVIGNVVATKKDPGLNSLRLLIIQGLDDSFRPQGTPYVAADGILTAGPGDIVYLVSKKEAAYVFEEELVPIDECIVGFVEDYFITPSALKRQKRKKKVKKPKVRKPPITKELYKLEDQQKVTKSPEIKKPAETEEPSKAIEPIESTEQEEIIKPPKTKVPRASKPKIRSKLPKQKISNGELEEE